MLCMSAVLLQPIDSLELFEPCFFDPCFFEPITFSESNDHDPWSIIHQNEDSSLPSCQASPEANHDFTTAMAARTAANAAIAPTDPLQYFNAEGEGSESTTTSPPFSSSPIDGSHLTNTECQPDMEVWPCSTAPKQKKANKCDAITFENLLNLAHLKTSVAARALNVSDTSFKIIKRKLGVTTWPHRTIKAVAHKSSLQPEEVCRRFSASIADIMRGKPWSLMTFTGLGSKISKDEEGEGGSTNKDTDACSDDSQPSLNCHDKTEGIPSGRKTLIKLSLACCTTVAYLPLHAAAKKCGMSPTYFKKKQRSLGIKRWPYRQIIRDASKLGISPFQYCAMHPEKVKYFMRRRTHMQCLQPSTQGSEC